MQLAFADWANLDGEFFPTYREIAEKARITKPGAIGIVQSMIEDREIELLQHGGSGRGRRNRYRFAEKYRVAARELSDKWSARRAEKVNKNNPSTKQKVKQDDPLKVNEDYPFSRERVNEDDPSKVKQDDPFTTFRVNEDGEKGKRGMTHVRNTVMYSSEREGRQEESPEASLALSAIDELANTLCSLYQIPDDAGWQIKDKYQHLAIQLHGLKATPIDVRNFYASRHTQKPGVRFFAEDFVTWRASQTDSLDGASEPTRPPVISAPPDYKRKRPNGGIQ